MPHLLRAWFVGMTMVAMGPVATARADDVPSIVRDYDAFARAQDPVRAAQRGDR